MLTKTIQKFLYESNCIEGEYSNNSMQDAIDAWYFTEHIAGLNFDNIMMIHKLLMVRKRPDIAGNIRKCQVYVGKHTPPNAGEVRRLLYLWIDEHGLAVSKRSIIEAHIRFEKIHPFEDGNGRVGRILLNWQMLKADKPIMIIESRKRNEYYQMFQKGFDVAKYIRKH